ncbi:ABC transporter ATP-binding protein [Bdellovibrio sp. HCB337]|uniref:ABC transporter ATP-binding protein n=1 Tax=Bdellovibrio sp. HCB337 TaxID=3394358 RepID=UPI0039A4E129
MAESTVLELKNIQKKFKDREVLTSVNLNLHAGEFLCLLGPSGCGKSTLLRLMAGLEEPTRGEVIRSTKEFGFVFQEAQLLAWRNVLENTRLPLELQKQLSQDEQNQKALAAIEKVQLKTAAAQYPHELSGGMKMRVSIARALSSSPKILFMDEPFSALDEVTRFSLQKQLRALCEKENLSVVFVTHSSYEAAFLADRVLMMSTQQGKFVLNEKLHYSQSRNEDLRASSEYQTMVGRLSQKMQEAFL